MLYPLAEHSEALISNVSKRVIPTNVACPCRCTFCCEFNFTKLLPWIKTRYMPPYTEKTFNFYEKIYKPFDERKCLSSSTAPIFKIGDNLQYFPNCDFFSLGLTPKQIEKLILKYKKSGYVLTLYTTGFNIDMKMMKYFSSKYPGVFRVHLSIITFDSRIRRNTMNPDIKAEDIKKMCAFLIHPVYFLLYFNKRQIISDIGVLNKFSIKNKGLIYIHRLYYNRLSPRLIIDYSNNAEREFEDIIYYLKANDKKLEDISKRLMFSPQSRIYAWAYRREVKKLLEICRGNGDEAIFCSEAAYEMIKILAGEKMHTIPVKSCFGGCIDFTLGVTVRAILLEIKKLLENNIALRHIYIPNTIFCVEGKYDLNYEDVNLINKFYPQIKINVVKLPDYIIDSTLSLDTCMHYYINATKHDYR